MLVVKNYTEIKKAETLRSDFIANVSHQLKTPLVSIKGFLESIAGPAKDDATAQQKFIKIMQEESNKMEDLIEDLMSLSRIESQAHIQPKDKVDIEIILNNLIETTIKLAEKNILALNLIVITIIIMS
jgi:Signal transduction histidine kinase